jgi:hypothetical protein
MMGTRKKEEDYRIPTGFSSSAVLAILKERVLVLFYECVFGAQKQRVR